MDEGVLREGGRRAMDVVVLVVGHGGVEPFPVRFLLERGQKFLLHFDVNIMVKSSSIGRYLNKLPI